MTIAIVVVAGFFGYNIFQKANYKIETGDTVTVSYSLITDEETYDSQSATVVIGNNDNKLITDEVLAGAKYGSTINFDTKLKEELTIDSETTVAKGTEVTVDGKISEVTPKQDETDSEASSEADSENGSEAKSEKGSETK